MAIRENLSRLLFEIERAAQLAHRTKDEISLVCVSKSRSILEIEEAHSLGLNDFGESRVQEALEKISKLAKTMQWHFIGHLQKNKVSKVIGHFVLIHSVDSYELAEQIDKISQSKGIKTSILLQVNVSGEKSKKGLSPDGWRDCFKKTLQLEHINIKGLMTMGPLTQDENCVREVFRNLRKLQDEFQLIAKSRTHLSELSMGMSQDFRIAIEEGATIIRIGSFLFNQ